ncbi:MAG: hypothetical protein IJG69_09505 [Spirochaetales bacterium]|nr:hypothetical protein [Spirochaetales bacterium]
MAKADKEIEEMRAFVTSAGCMTIEHIATEVRRSRTATTQSEIRHGMERLKHYMDILQEDFRANFPKGKVKNEDIHRQ